MDAASARANVTSPVVFYDGECPFCLRSIRFLLEHDPEGRLRFAPLQGTLAREVLRAEERALGPESSVILYESGRSPRTAMRSEAMARALAYLPYPWRLAGVLRSIPTLFPVLDIAYRAIARRRRMLVGDDAVCELPVGELRGRFID